MHVDPIPRRAFLQKAGSAAGLLWLNQGQGAALGAREQFPRLQPRDGGGRLGPLIHAPSEPGAWAEWRRELAGWRESTRRRLAYDDGLYRREDLRWASGCFTCGLVMMCDETFHDPASGRFTVEAFLEGGRREFGGYDAIVLWHAYRTVALRPVRVVAPAFSVPPGMAEIPGGRVALVVEYRSRECGFDEPTPAADRLWGWAPLHEARFVSREVTLRRYAIDRTPVTNAEFARFLESTGYRPNHPERFLAHWSNGIPPAGLEDHPVVYVCLEDARAFAAWAGKRLPTEEEWQYAAAGPEARLYPWGDEPRKGVSNEGRTLGTTPVRSFPDGRSPFGLYDCCGNVWQWTESERSDGRTRFCSLKGGSFYEARGSDWYADGGLKPCRFAAKFLLMWPGLDRCATVGFRCALGLGG